MMLPIKKHAVPSKLFSGQERKHTIQLPAYSGVAAYTVYAILSYISSDMEAYRSTVPIYHGGRRILHGPLSERSSYSHCN